MAHDAQHKFVSAVKAMFPENFAGRTVDFGSYDINGSFKSLVEGEYTGVDQEPGPNVDVVCKCHEFDGADYDLVLSGEMLEHDPTWPLSLKKMYEVCRPGGLVILTMAAPGREPHGHSWYCEHYMNLTEQDIRLVWDCETLFSSFQFMALGADLYFWGLKRCD